MVDGTVPKRNCSVEAKRNSKSRKNKDTKNSTHTHRVSAVHWLYYSHAFAILSILGIHFNLSIRFRCIYVCICAEMLKNFWIENPNNCLFVCVCVCVLDFFFSSHLTRTTDEILSAEFFCCCCCFVLSTMSCWWCYNAIYVLCFREHINRTENGDAIISKH